jgi:hypothetical protein
MHMMTRLPAGRPGNRDSIPYRGTYCSPSLSNRQSKGKFVTVFN